MSLGKKKAPTIPVNKWGQKVYELGDKKRENMFSINPYFFQIANGYYLR